MDLNKHLSWFNPVSISQPVHVLGCGAIGSNVSQGLVRLGIDNIHLWDFDTVDEHNITNQAFTSEHIGMEKTDALVLMLREINPDVNITVHGKYTNEPLSGIVFLNVDSIELRREIIELNRYNPTISILIDSRIGLEEGQVYAAAFNDEKAIQRLLDNSNFKDDETDAPVSACGTTLSVIPTVMITVHMAIANLINYIKDGEYKHTILCDAFSFQMVSYG